MVLQNGINTTCQKMIDHRIGPADQYLAEHRPPGVRETAVYAEM